MVCKIAFPFIDNILSPESPEQIFVCVCACVCVCMCVCVCVCVFERDYGLACKT